MAIIGRGVLSMAKAIESGIVGSVPPDESPLATIEGRARIGRASSTGAILELHPTAFVLRHRGPGPHPLVVERQGLGRIRIGPGVFGTSLRCFDRGGRRVAVLFWATDRDAMHPALTHAGWATMLA